MPALPPTPPAVHTPPAHDSPSAHTRPHEPQLAVLIIVLMQAPPHSAFGAAQPHDPLVHAVPPVQALLQKPQLVGSEARIAQLGPHFSSPAAQLLVHAPCEQTCSWAQTVPQLPQFKASDVVLTQAMPHALRPPAHTHMLPAHS
jgi:hypothetical protein